MNRLWHTFNKDDWDTSSIPTYCNIQAYLVTQLLVDICKPKNVYDDHMLTKLIQNLTMLALAYQHLKNDSCKDLFMNWWNDYYHQWDEKETFVYNTHNRHVVKWLEGQEAPACIKERFQGAHYGIFEHAYRSNLMVSVIAKAELMRKELCTP